MATCMADSTKDIEYLGNLQDYYAKHRGFPSYTRLCDILGLAAKSAVKKVLERLAEHQYLERTPDDVWVPARRFFERTLADESVPAGMPASAQEVRGESFIIDEHLIDKPSKTTLIRVKGDSMIDVGIHDGDMVVVEKRPTAHIGDIVVAIVDNAFTVKTLGRERGKFILLPANKAYPVIRPQGSLEIFGVVVGLARKYRPR